MSFQPEEDVNSVIHSHHHSLNTVNAPAHPSGKSLFSGSRNSHQSLQSNKSSSIQQDSGLPISNIHLPASSFDPQNSGYDLPPPDHDTPSPELDTQYPEDDSAYPDYGTQYPDYNAQYQEYLTKCQDDDTQYQDDNNNIAQIPDDDTQYLFGDTPSPICDLLKPTTLPNTSQKSDFISPNTGFVPSHTLDYGESATKFSPQNSDFISPSFGAVPSQTFDYGVSTPNFSPQTQKFSPQKSDFVSPSLGFASSQTLDYGVSTTNFVPQTQKISSQKPELHHSYANHSPATPNLPPYSPYFGQQSPRHPSQTLGFASPPQLPLPQTFGFSLPPQQHPLQTSVRPPPIPSPHVKKGTVAPSQYYGPNLKKSIKTSTNTDTTTQYIDPLISNSVRDNQFLKPIGDSDCIDVMVLAAKTGKWDTVWRILDEKPHIVNCIPKERAWSALHQAAYHNNENAVRILLKYPDCDPEIRTKQDRTGKFGPSKAPMDLTKSQAVKAMLTTKIQQNNSMFHSNSPKPTLIQMSEFGKPMGRCIYLTLDCCKGFLIPKESRVSDISINSLPQVMKLVFSFINCLDYWILAKDNVSLTLQQYSIELGNLLWTGDISKSKGAESRQLNSDRKTLFFIRAIKLYTGERKKLHKTVNDMLRNQAHKPTSLELSLGPYALLLNSILMEWNELKPYQGTTYRACQLSAEEAVTYFPGQQFAWLSFSSSSKIQREPCNYLFIIDNRFSAKWAPREIMHYSEFPSEQECLYAFGAKFRVTSVDKLAKKICLILIDNN